MGIKIWGEGSIKREWEGVGFNTEKGSFNTLYRFVRDGSQNRASDPVHHQSGRDLKRGRRRGEGECGKYRDREGGEGD